MQMAKVNKDVLIGLLFWFGYGEVLVSLTSVWTGWNWWYLQPVAILISIFMVAMTFGSQTRSDKND
jgi:hypothetical protein